MKTQKHSLMLFTIMIVLNACSIEKKHASFGYHTEWRNNKFKNTKKPLTIISSMAFCKINYLKQ